MKINVDYYGYTEPVTVQSGYWIGEEFVSEWCNHANAQQDTEVVDYMTYEGHDQYERDYFKCDKCPEIFEYDDFVDMRDDE